MTCKIQARDIIENITIHLSVNSDDQCPICKANLSLSFISGIIHDGPHDEKILSTFNRCSKCGDCYLNKYIENLDYKDSTDFDYLKIASFPNKFDEVKFDNNISSLSPNFVEIYNQAKHAEQLHLDQIAGIGYRKSIEFLIKDFVISNILIKLRISKL